MFLGVSAAAARHAVLAAHQAGYALQKLRKLVQRGSWTSVLEDVVHIPHTSAYRYLKLAEKYPTLESVPEGKSLTELYEIFAEEKGGKACRINDPATKEKRTPENRNRQPILQRVLRLLKVSDRLAEDRVEDLDAADAKRVQEELAALIERLVEVKGRLPHRSSEPEPDVNAATLSGLPNSMPQPSPAPATPTLPPPPPPGS